MQIAHFFLLGNSNLSGRRGGVGSWSSRLGQNPNFDRKLVLQAPLKAVTKKTDRPILVMVVVRLMPRIVFIIEAICLFIEIEKYVNIIVSSSKQKKNNYLSARNLLWACRLSSQGVCYQLQLDLRQLCPAPPACSLHPCSLTHPIVGISHTCREDKSLWWPPEISPRDWTIMANLRPDIWCNLVRFFLIHRATLL